MTKYNIEYQSENLHERINCILNNNKVDKFIEVTILFVTGMIESRFSRSLDINIDLILDGDNLELTFIYHSQFYNPIYHDEDDVNSCRTFFNYYFDVIYHDYKSGINKLTFKVIILSDKEMDKRYIEALGKNSLKIKH